MIRQTCTQRRRTGRASSKRNRPRCAEVATVGLFTCRDPAEPITAGQPVGEPLGRTRNRPQTAQHPPRASFIAFSSLFLLSPVLTAPNRRAVSRIRSLVPPTCWHPIAAFGLTHGQSSSPPIRTYPSPRVHIQSPADVCCYRYRCCFCCRAPPIIYAMPAMACTSTGASTSVMTTQEEPIRPSHRGYGTINREEQRRRRHSSHHTSHTRPWTVDSENVQILVCSPPPTI